jgi:hypothetical protein
MRADTQFSVVEATLKGYQKWIIAHGRSPQEDVRLILCEVWYRVLLIPYNRSSSELSSSKRLRIGP